MTDPAPPSTASPAVEPLSGRIALLRGFLRVRRDPEPFMAGLARRAVDELPFPLRDRLVLDLGCGTGHVARELARRGHTVVSTDLSLDDLEAGRPPRAFGGDATRLAIRDGAVDGVVCSNVLEHTPTPELVLGEIERVLRSGGWAWVSWTPWWTPFGGHAIAPLHYLGPARGLRAYRRLFGEPTGTNLPFAGVWPTTVRQVMDAVAALPGLELIDALPRYYPSQRWLMRLEHVREVAVWNCVLLLRRG